MMQPDLSDSVASALTTVTEADKTKDNSTKETEDAEAIDLDEHEDEMAYKDYKVRICLHTFLHFILIKIDRWE